MLDLLTHLDGSDTNALLAAIDSLPASVYNLVKPSIDMDTVVGIGLFLVALYAISYVLSAVQGWIMATITQRVSKEMRSDISHKINRLPMWYYNRTTTGDVLSRVTNDVDTIGQSLNQSIGGLLSAVVLLLGSLVMMLLTNVWMTLTAVVASLLGFALMFAIMGKSQKYFRRQQKHLGQLNGHIEEIYTGHTVVKAYNGEAHAQAQFDEMNANLCSSNFKAQCLSGLMMPIMSFIGNFGYVAVCVVGGAMALNDAISFRGHRGLHAVRPVLHPAPVPDRPGGPVPPVRRRRGGAGLRVPGGPGDGGRGRQAHRPAPRSRARWSSAT